MEPIKKLSKDLQDEGLTIELVNRVIRMKEFSPAQFQKGDEPVNLMAANEKEFWIKLSDGSFLKDNGKLMKFDFKTCVFARARYLVKHEEKEKKQKVKQEIKRLQAEIDEKILVVIKNIDELFNYADFDLKKEKNKEGLEGLLISIAIEESGENSGYIREMKDKQERALNLFQKTPREQFQALKDNLLSLQTKKLYDQLHISLMTHGLPLIGSFGYNNEQDTGVLIKMFHRDKIESTLDLIKEKPHLEIIARINIEKQYI